jgi:peroxiredoxin
VLARTVELVDEYAPRGVEFLGVSTDTKKAPEEVLAFFREKDQRYPLAVDSSKEVKTLWEINWIPTVVLIDTAGKVRAVAKDLDGQNLETFRTALDQVLEEGRAE